MALHGEIKINDWPIGYWDAQRIDNLDLRERTSLYYCTYVRGEVDFGVWQTQYAEEATIEHAYADGAEVLAAKVLTLAEGGW